jgi:ankyrin repeat protein
MPSNDEPERQLLEAPDVSEPSDAERDLHGEKPPDLSNARSTAMLAFTCQGCVAGLVGLLDDGIDPDAVHSVVSNLGLNSNSRFGSAEAGEFETTALQQAADSGQLHTARLLLDRGADPNLIVNALTPLMNAMFASRHGSANAVPMTKLLLERGATLDVCITDRTGGLLGWTAFHFACNEDDPDVAEVLVRAGCDTSVKTFNGNTGKQIAQIESSKSCKGAAVLERLSLLEREDKRRAKMNDEVVEAAKAGAAETLTRLLDAGGETDASVPDVDVNGNACATHALYFAASNGHLETARVLLGHGADPNLGNTSGVSPIMVAACKGQSTVVELLLEHEADARLASRGGWTAFHYACYSNELRTAELVVQAGCDMSVEDEVGCSGKQLAQVGH